MRPRALWQAGKYALTLAVCLLLPPSMHRGRDTEIVESLSVQGADAHRQIGQRLTGRVREADAEGGGGQQRDRNRLRSVCAAGYCSIQKTATSFTGLPSGVTTLPTTGALAACAGVADLFCALIAPPLNPATLTTAPACCIRLRNLLLECAFNAASFCLSLSCLHLC